MTYFLKAKTSIQKADHATYFVTKNQILATHSDLEVYIRQNTKKKHLRTHI